MEGDGDTSIVVSSFSLKEMEVYGDVGFINPENNSNIHQGTNLSDGRGDTDNNAQEMTRTLQVANLPRDEEDNMVPETNPTMHCSSATGGEKKKTWTETLSEDPTVCVYHNFLSEKECAHLIKLGKPHLHASKVNDGGQAKFSSNRTSSGTVLQRGQDEIIREIEKRIADITSVPVENGEGLQILHYGVGQKFGAHYDYNDNASYMRTSGPRMATIIMYLSDVEEGGETVFPLLKGNMSSVPGGGLSIKPEKGDALLFWSMKADGSRESLSLHCGSPVIKGDKWSCTKWLHLKSYPDTFVWAAQKPGKYHVKSLKKSITKEGVECEDPR